MGRHQVLGNVDLTIEYEGNERTLSQGTVAIIGADPASTVHIARAGISRRHATVQHNGSHWVIQDASSRNGTFHSGSRFQILDIDGTTKIRLGHPTEGAEIVLTPVDDNASTRVITGESEPVPTTKPVDEPEPFRLPEAPPTKRPELDLDPRLDNLIDALNDTVSSVKGLTWSVWAMIAVTAALVVLTLFVAIVGN